MRKTSNLEASRTINYKDALTITGRLDVIREFPLIPGVVTACGLALLKFELPGAMSAALQCLTQIKMRWQRGWL
jgi:NADPH:quinone reductase-like Zn-dependent oxidoreductase